MYAVNTGYINPNKYTDLRLRPKSIYLFDVNISLYWPHTKAIIVLFNYLHTDYMLVCYTSTCFEKCILNFWYLGLKCLSIHWYTRIDIVFHREHHVILQIVSYWKVRDNRYLECKHEWNTQIKDCFGGKVCNNRFLKCKYTNEDCFGGKFCDNRYLRCKHECYTQIKIVLTRMSATTCLLNVNISVIHK